MKINHINTISQIVALFLCLFMIGCGTTSSGHGVDYNALQNPDFYHTVRIDSKPYPSGVNAVVVQYSTTCLDNPLSDSCKIESQKQNYNNTFSGTQFSK